MGKKIKNLVEVYKTSWEIYRKNFSLIVVLVLTTYSIIELIAFYIPKGETLKEFSNYMKIYSKIEWLIGSLSFLAVMFLVKKELSNVDYKKDYFTLIKKAFKKYFSFLWARIIYAFYFIPMILFIAVLTIPIYLILNSSDIGLYGYMLILLSIIFGFVGILYYGIYLFKISFWKYVFVFEDKKAIESFKSSKEKISGKVGRVFWDVFLLYIPYVVFLGILLFLAWIGFFDNISYLTDYLSSLVIDILDYFWVVVFGVYFYQLYQEKDLDNKEVKEKK